MNPDDFQQAWRASSPQSHLSINSDLLIQDLRRRQLQFEYMTVARDIREVVVALIMVPVWLFLGWAWSLHWTWYLGIPGMIFVAAFIVVDRRVHSQRPPEPTAPIREQIAHALVQIEHQIWLLRNVFWWYILPIALPCAAFFGQNAWELRTRGWENALVTLVVTAISGGIFGFVYWLNQKAVRCTLEPRRQELETLLSSLGDEASS